MNNTTITEKYALCMLKENRKLTSETVEPNIIISMIVEMMLDNNINIVDKKIMLNDKQPTKKYNIKLYNYIKDLKKEKIKIADIISKLFVGFSNKGKEIINDLIDEMKLNNLIIIENKYSLFKVKEKILLNDKEFSNMLNQLRKNLVDEEKLTNDLILLSSLLNSSKSFNKIFTKYENDIFKKRLKEIKNTEIDKNVKIANDVINDLETSIVLSVTLFQNL